MPAKHSIPPTEVHRTQLRLPRELAGWLRHRAVDNFHSVNAEIVRRLQQSRVEQEQERAR